MKEMQLDEGHVSNLCRTRGTESSSMKGMQLDEGHVSNLCRTTLSA
jgi:hypothetical protein